MPVLDWLQGMMGGTPQKYGTLVPGGALAVPQQPPGVLDRLGAMLTTPAWDQVQQSDEQTRALIDQGRYADATRQGLDNPMLGAFGGNIKRAYQGPPIRAYHGSPHQFDPEPGAPYGRFRNDKIGEGEGAQAYGYGMPYLAEAESVGKNYRDALSASQPSQILDAAGQPVASYKSNASLWGQRHDLADRLLPGNKDDPLDWMRTSAVGAWLNNKLKPPHPDDIMQQAFGEGWARHSTQTYPMAEALAERTRALEGYAIKAPGHMYEVDIHADPNRFLDWDKRLALQPDMAALLEKKRIPGFDPDITGRELYERASEVFGGEAGASRVLQKSGVAGTRYLDEGSRFNPAILPDNPIANEARQFLAAANGDSAAALRAFNDSNPVLRLGGPERDEIRKVIEAASRKVTSNYAMFDPKLVEILRRYGILGPTAATGLLGATAADE